MIENEKHDEKMEEVIKFKDKKTPEEKQKATELLLNALKKSQLIQADFFEKEYEDQLRYAAALILDKQFLKAIIRHQGNSLRDLQEELVIKDTELKRAQDRIVELSKPH